MNSFQAPEWLPPFLVPFVTLSYPTVAPAKPDSFPDASYYGTGLLDGCFIITVIAIMAILRDVTRIYIMEPFARWKLEWSFRHSQSKLQGANGNGNGAASHNGHTHQTNGRALAPIPPKSARRIQHNVTRFAEQGWSVIYYTVLWSYGYYVHRNVPVEVLDPKGVWLNYPHIPLAGPVKLYYLTQTAFYLHQVLILNAEARRKDHYQMMTHHVITISLQIGSYFMNMTRVGCLVLVLMDWCDIFLPAAKMLRYLGFSTLCDITFTWFLACWFITRHVLFIIVIKSLFYDASALIPFGWHPERGHYWTKACWMTNGILLVALEIIQIIWFSMIVGVAWRVVTGKGAEDTRSDDEDESSVPDTKKDR